MIHRIVPVFLLAILFNVSLHSQNTVNQSEIFPTCTVIYDIETAGNLVFVNHQYFVTVTDILTGTTTYYNRELNNLPVPVIDAFDIAPNGQMWMAHDSMIFFQNGVTWDSIVLPNVSATFMYVRSIEALPNNEIWVTIAGTTPNEGIAHYSNAMWTRYNSTNSGLPYDNNFITVYCDPLNNVWVGGSNTGLTKFDGTTWTNYTTANSGLPHNTVRNITSDLSGNIWAATTLGAALFNGTVWTVYNSVNGLYDDYVNEIDVDPISGEVLVANQDGISILNGSTWSGFDYSNSIIGSFSSRYVSCCAHAPGSTWYVACNKGLVNYDGSNFTQKIFTYYTSGTAATGVTMDTLGNKWLCGDTKYWTKFDGNNWNTMSVQDISLVADSNMIFFHNYVRDTSGALWGIPKSGGVERVVGTQRTFFTTANSGLPSNIVLSVDIDSSNNVWFATNAGAVKFDGSTWQVYNTSNSALTNNSINVVRVAPDGHSVWFCIPSSSQGGVVGFDGTSTWTSYAASNWPFGVIPSSMEFDQRGNLYVASSSTSGGLMKLDTAGNWSLFNTTTNPNLPSDWFFSMHVDRYDNIWMGSANGNIVKFDGVNFTVFNPDSAVWNGGYIRVSLMDEFGNLWFGCNFTGLKAGVFNEYGVNNNAMHPITGAVFRDANGNGVRDAGENGMVNQHVLLLPDSLSAYTNANGQFGFPYAAGPYTVQLLPTNDWQISTDSVEYHIPFNPQQIGYYDFGLTPTTPHDSAQVFIIAAMPAMCNQGEPAWITYNNAGNVTRDAEIKLVTDSLVSFFYSMPQEDSLLNDTVRWNRNNVQPFESAQIYTRLFLPGSQSLGDTVQNIAALHLLDTLTNMTVYSVEDTVVSIVVCAYDPNDKSVIPSGDSSAIHATPYGSALTYVVRFQNTGTAVAFDVIIRDTLNPNLDFSTFQFLGASHDVQTSVSASGAVAFSFINIMLPDSGANEPESHGFVMYRIQHRATISDSTPITNTAHIYFDHNPAVVTNTTLNTMVWGGGVAVPEISAEQTIQIYPNPSTGVYTIRSVTKGESSLTVFNASGQIILTQPIPTASVTSLDLSSQPDGIYFYRVTDAGAGDSTFGKLIITR